MSRRMFCLLGLLAILGVSRAGAGAAEDERVEVEAAAEVRGLRLADADGDGLADLLLLEGRIVRIYRGRKDALPESAATWSVTAPAGASFVDVAPPGEAGPALIAFGRDGAQRLPLTPGTPALPVPGGTPLSWRDSGKLTFSDLSRPDGALLLPRADGWSYQSGSTPAGKDLLLPLAPYRAVSAPGPFLEDTCAITWALPGVVLGVGAAQDAARNAPCLWGIDGQSIVAAGATGTIRYDLTFLENNAAAGAVEQRLVDLDGDGRPELFHRVHENRETRYGFFHTKPAPTGSTTGPSHRPATSALYLPGYQFPPDFEDVNGDGRPDLIVTSIAINPANTFLAMTTGTVKAETLAFLNQGGGEAGYFRDEADGVVESKIGVHVRFNYRGTIEVERFFTIFGDGDVNGDGRKDLCIRTADDALTIYEGRAEGAWAKEGRTLSIPPRGAHPDIEGYAADLDGDGKDEVVLLYRKPPTGRDRVWILRAK